MWVMCVLCSRKGLPIGRVCVCVCVCGVLRKEYELRGVYLVC